MGRQRSIHQISPDDLTDREMQKGINESNRTNPKRKTSKSPGSQTPKRKSNSPRSQTDHRYIQTVPSDQQVTVRTNRSEKASNKANQVSLETVTAAGRESYDNKALPKTKSTSENQPEKNQVKLEPATQKSSPFSNDEEPLRESGGDGRTSVSEETPEPEFQEKPPITNAQRIKERLKECEKHSTAAPGDKNRVN